MADSDLPPPPPPPPSRRQTIESLQKDIEFGNSYRMESIKQMLGMATALLAFTVVFRPSLGPVFHGWLVGVGWLGLGLSVLCGILLMHCWERFYLSYRKDWKGRSAEGEATRKVVNFWRRVFMWAQFVSFAIGVLGVAAFAALNIGNVASKT